MADVTRWRRPGAGEILLVYVLLAAIGFTWNWLSRTYGSPAPLWSFLIAAFLAWRVSRGGRVSRMILVIASVASCAMAVLAVARRWDLSVVALVIIGAAQVALLVSPPVYGRTRRPGRSSARAPGWAQLVRRPPAWLLSWGLLAGVLVTLACLGSMDWVAIPGCRPGRVRRVHRPGRGLPAALADRPPERAGHLQGRAAQRLRAVGTGQHVAPVPGLARADGPGRPARLSWRTRGERPPFC